MGRPGSNIGPMSNKNDNSYAVFPPRPAVERLGEGRLRIRAPAKINLNLLVGPRGGDGLHRIDSLVAKVTLYDQLDVRLRDDGRITFSCQGFDCPTDRSNLAFRAAAAIAEGRDVPGAGIDLAKHIPPGKGLGGGSSDAAAVLSALNELWRLELHRAELTELAGRLGSDVPLFVGPDKRPEAAAPAVRITDDGRHVERAAVHSFRVILVLPEFSCGTAEVYRAYDEEPTVMEQQLDPQLPAGSPPSSWRHLLVNQLTGAARRVCPALGEMLDNLAGAVPAPVHMTGSGSAAFILCDDDAEAAAIAAAVPTEIKPDCIVVGQNNW